jgi:Zn-dependent protease
MYYKLGLPESFLLDCLQRRLPTEEILTKYQREFGCTITADRVRAFIEQMRPRGLLEGTPQGALEATANRVAAERGRKNLLRARWPNQWLTQLVRRAAPAFAWMLAPALMVPLSVFGLSVCFFVLAMVPLWASERTALATTLPAALLLALSVIVHEFFHAVACARAGGNAQEVGIMWRAPVFVAYCTVDDVVLFRSRRDRVVTAYAGTYANLLLMLAGAVMLKTVPSGSAVHRVVAAYLFMSAVAVLVNLVPLFGLDGYRMLEHSLGVWSLQSSSFSYVRSRVTGAQRPLHARVALIYWIYALSTTAAGGGILCALGLIWWRTLRPLVGAAWSAGILAGEAGLVVLVSMVILRHRKPKGLSGPRFEQFGRTSG